ncbi:MAG TPA: hypothetical protein VL117_10365 [Thermoleophilia bacterium]|nr:hypothetical protein [Thermoleophilia bacterium]
MSAKRIALVVVVGFVFGAADQYLGSRMMLGDHFALGPWASTVSAMSAPWLLLPFLVGCTEARAGRAAALGLIATLAALIGYFALMWSPVEGVALSRSLPQLGVLLGSQRANIVGGLLTGPLFGYLGQRWRVGGSWAAAALLAGAFCLEPLARWRVGQLSPPLSVWGVETAAGALGALCLAGAALARRRRLS